MESPQIASGEFHFADYLALDESLTRQYFDGLLRGLAHKSNNLLAVVQGFSTLILMQDDLDPTVRENIEHIKEAGQNSSRLFERILTAGGCATVTLQPIQLGEFLPMAQGSLTEVCEKNGVNFQLNMEPSVPQLAADATKLKEILLELVSNAAEAAGTAGGEMAVDVLAPGQTAGGDPERVDIFVRNTGAEIPVDHMDKVFKPFFTTKESDHFGIGLAIAGVLAHQMGMRIGAQSANNTTTFWLSCPVS